MAVMPVTPIASAPSSRGQSSDGSAADPNGFGSLLGGLDADRHDSGGTADGAASGGTPRTPTRAHGTPPEKQTAPPAKGKLDQDQDGPTTDGNGAAKAAGPANGAARANGAASNHAAAGKAAPGKQDKQQDKSDETDADASATAASAPLAAASPATAQQAPSDGTAAGQATAAADALQPVAPAAGDTGIASADASLAAVAPALAAGTAGLQPDPAIAAASPSPMDAAASPAPALPTVDTAPLAAASAFGNAVLDAATSVSPLTGNPATPDGTPPSIAASLLAAVKTPSGGGAPAAALARTAPGPQSVVAAPSAPSELLAPVPQASAAPVMSDAPVAAAAPQASIAPAIAAAVSLLSEMAGDGDRIVIRALPHGDLVADLHNGKAAAGGPATGLPAASFGNALFPAGAIPALAAALLGGGDDLPSDPADGPLQNLEQELAAEASPAESEKAPGEAHGATSAPASGNGSALSVPSFAAAVAHAEATGPSGSMEAARPLQQPAAMPPMPALQIMPSLTRAAGDGGGRFNIQLHPQELGRVRVELDIDHDGHVTAAISAAHPATLDLLRRDAAALQQALNDAGLKTDGNALSFNLQGNGQDMGDGSGRSSRSGAPVVPPAVDPLEDAAPKTGAISLGGGLVAVDIRI